MGNRRYSDIIEDIRFMSNKISDILDEVHFDSLERKILRQAQDILDNKVFQMEDFKNEEECWS